MAREDDTSTISIEILEISIRELSSKYAVINSLHDQLRAKVLALLAVIIAGATYMYSDLKIMPAEQYGKILFILATVTLLAVFAMLLKCISSVDWHSPVEWKEIQRAENIYDSKLDYLKYIRDDYITAVRGNAAIVAAVANRFNQAIYLLSISAIILIVIKGGYL